MPKRKPFTLKHLTNKELVIVTIPAVLLVVIGGILFGIIGCIIGGALGGLIYGLIMNSFKEKRKRAFYRRKKAMQMNNRLNPHLF